MPGSITNAYPELFAEPEVFTPNVTIPSPDLGDTATFCFSEMEVGPKVGPAASLRKCFT